ncbi:hypothetical protein ACV07N_14275 [Roseivirga echinicomitans]
MSQSAYKVSKPASKGVGFLLGIGTNERWIQKLLGYELSRTINAYNHVTVNSFNKKKLTRLRKTWWRYHIMVFSQLLCFIDQQNNMKQLKLTQILISALIVLVAIDIITGIFFWNREYLFFDSTLFNNITTPIISILSLIIYSAALLFTIKQNKIIFSQHMRPYFEKQINRIQFEYETEKIDTSFITTDKEYNGINYPNLIAQQLLELTKSNDYNLDLVEFKKGNYLQKKHYESRDYFGIVMFLSQFLGGVYTSFKYDRIRELVAEIEASKMLDEDKLMLKKTIKKDLVINYVSLIKSEDSWQEISPPFPILFNPNSDKIEFKNISETNFRNSYDWLIKTL